ncbi:hypothetical protein [Mannheimia haemolytica]|uniref:hypothetical protein n=1 Tax=Mannheimia haemolytica TaxID=75985 RepID=UPI001FEECF67|nr:hypothetical protein [Mannheimia haemolytica]
MIYPFLIINEQAVKFTRFRSHFVPSAKPMFIAENEKPPKNITPQNNVVETTAVELISEEQLSQIRQLMQVTGTEEAKILAYIGVQALNQIPKSQAEAVIKKLNLTLDKQNAEKADNGESVGEEIPL